MPGLRSEGWTPSWRLHLPHLWASEVAVIVQIVDAPSVKRGVAVIVIIADALVVAYLARLLNPHCFYILRSPRTLHAPAGARSPGRSSSSPVFESSVLASAVSGASSGVSGGFRTGWRVFHLTVIHDVLDVAAIKSFKFE